MADDNSTFKDTAGNAIPASNPLSGIRQVSPWTGDYRTPTPQQVQAADPQYFAEHPGPAMANSYFDPMSPDHSFGANIGRSLRSFAQNPNPNVFGQILNQGMLPGGLLGGGLGALAGLGLGAVRGTPWRTAALMGLIGAGLGGYSGYERAKTASDPKQEILQAIATSNLGPTEKMQLMSVIPQLTFFQADDLARKIDMAGGFAIGALITHYLFGTGLLGSLLGGLVGGSIGSGIGNHQRLDMFGNPVY